MTGLEHLLTDVKAHPQKDEATLHLRGAGELIVPLTEHLYTSRHFSRVEQLRAVAEEASQLEATQVSTRERGKGNPFNVVQVRGPPSIAPLLRERFGTHFDTKGYTATARDRYGKPGEIISISEELEEEMRAAKEHNQAVKALHETLDEHLQGRSKRYRTRVRRELAKATKGEHHAHGYLQGLPAKITEERERLQQRRGRLGRTPGLQAREEDEEVTISLQDTSHLQGKRTARLEELITQGWAHLDIEIPGWNTPRKEITWVVVHYERAGAVYRRELHTATSLGTKSFRGHHVRSYDGDVAALIIGVKESIRKQDPLFLTAHNNNYDYIHLRDAPELTGIEEDFTPDEDDRHRPVRDATTKFMERVGIKSRLMMDFLWLGRTIYDWAPNKKLDLIAKLVLGPDEGKTGLTYEEMEQLDAKARRHDLIKDQEGIELVLAQMGKTLKDTHEESIAAAKKIAPYATNDVDLLARIRASETFINYLRRTLHYSSILQAPLEHLAYSPRTVLRVHERSFRRKTGADRDKLFMSRKDARKEYSEDKQAFRKELESIVGAEAAPGLYKEVHLFHLDYAKALRGLIVRNSPELENLFTERGASVEDEHHLAVLRDASADWAAAAYAHVKGIKRSLDTTRQKIAGYNHEQEKTVAHVTGLLQRKGKSYREALWRGTLSPEAVEEALQEQPLVLVQQPRSHEEAADLTALLNQRSRLSRARHRFHQQFGGTPEAVEGALEELAQQAHDTLESLGLSIIHQAGPYLYLHGDATDLRLRHPRRVVHTFNEALITRDHSPTGNGRQRLYSKVHGYYQGIKVVDHPTHHLTIHDMRAFDRFYTAYAQGRYEEAALAIAESYQEIKKRAVAAEDLILHSKSSDRYAAYEDEQKVYYRTGLPAGITYHPFFGFIGEEDAPVVELDERTGRPYTLESINGSQRRVYVTRTEELRLDWEAYEERDRRRAQDLLGSLIGEELLEGILDGSEAAYRPAGELLRAQVRHV